LFVGEDPHWWYTFFSSRTPNLQHLACRRLLIHHAVIICRLYRLSRQFCYFGAANAAQLMVPANWQKNQHASNHSNHTVVVFIDIASSQPGLWIMLMLMRRHYRLYWQQ
jgi:hypothetical protein